MAKKKTATPKRPVVDTLLEMVVVREIAYRNSTKEIFEAASFIEKGIIGFFETEHPERYKFEAIEIVDQQFVIQVSSPLDVESMDPGHKLHRLYTICIPFEVISAHDAELLTDYLNNMTAMDVDDDASLDEMNEALAQNTTIQAELVVRRVIH